MPMPLLKRVSNWRWSAWALRLQESMGLSPRRRSPSPDYKRQRLSGGRFPNVAYVGGLPRDVREADIEDAFAKYGKVRCVVLKTGFCYVEMVDAEDAQYAIRKLQDWRNWDGTPLQGEKRLSVQEPRTYRGFGAGSSRLGSPMRDPPPSDRCFKCGGSGHWARDCRGREVERGRSLSPRRSRSRSRSRSHSPRRHR